MTKWRFDFLSVNVKYNFLLRIQEIPLEEEWRIPYLTELISAKNNKIVTNGVDQAELDDIINFICTT